MSTTPSRRSFLRHAAAGFSTFAVSRFAQAQAATEPPPRPLQVEHAIAAPVSVEVNARSIPHFEPRDRTRTRFGSLDYRSGLVLTSSYRGYDFARSNPEQAADILAKTFAALDRDIALAQIRDINELIVDAPVAAKGVGYLRDDRMVSTLGFIDKAFELNGKVKLHDIYTNALLGK